VKVLRRPQRGPEPLAEHGRGRRRLALAVPVLAVVCGLVAGGLAGARLVTGRRAAAVTRPAGAWAGPKGTSGPIEQLKGAGTLLFTDPQGRAYAQAADGRDRRTLGQLAELAAQRPPDHDLNAAALLAMPPDERTADLGADTDQVYLRTADGAAAVGRLSNGSLRRLVPAGWRSPGPPRHAADGSVVGVCGYRLGGGGRSLPAVTAATSWILDGSGKRLATLPGCLYDLSADGRSALVADPAEGRRAGPVPEVTYQSQPPVGRSDQLTRGLRLWRRGGGFRPVLGFDQVVRAFRTIQPRADPDGLVIVEAQLGPGGHQAMVRILDAKADLNARTGPEATLLAEVDLDRGRVEPLPEHLPGYVAFLPTGGLVWTGGAGTATYLPTHRPPQLLRSGLANDGVYAVVPSPDGAWVLLAGATWRLIRTDDPSVQVSYPAPGRLASFIPEAGR
jgi:hypothetical protein